MNKTLATAAALTLTGAGFIAAPTVFAQTPAASSASQSAVSASATSASATSAKAPGIGGTSQQLRVTVPGLIYGKPSKAAVTALRVDFRVPVLSTQGAGKVTVTANQPGVSCATVNLTPGVVSWVNCSGTAARGVLKIQLATQTGSGTAHRSFALRVR
jgi:hypothetical protein